MLRVIFKLLGKGKKLPILIYHQVLPEPDIMRPFEPTAREFEVQMKAIKQHMTPVSLEEGISRLNQGTLPADAIAVTFDDGYENNFSVALPILKKLEIPATFYIASDFLNGGIMWNDIVLETFRQIPLGGHDLSELGLGKLVFQNDEERFPAAGQCLVKLKHLPFNDRLAIVEKLTAGYDMPKNLMMSHQQLKELSNSGMSIGGHTLAHPILTKLPLSEARTQIADNKQAIETIIGKPISSFAYPNGKPVQDYDLDIREIVKSTGYTTAVSTSHGVGDISTHPYEYPRYTPWRRNKWGFLFQLMQNYYAQASYL